MAQSKAETWYRRAAEAKSGMLLFRSEERNDPEFMREYGDLISECQAQTQSTTSPRSRISSY